MKNRLSPTLKVCTLATTAALLLSACGQTLSTHGHIILPSRLAQIKPGVSTQADVRQLLGTPSTTSTLGANTWYYMTNITKDKPLNPNILQSSQVVQIAFDPSGTVTGLTQKTTADAKAVEPSPATTRTEGQALGIVEQLLGNVGLK
jgi:outer membrane protein assembly factor BamE (lipoprotein component of BamABCDE complex)